MNQLLKRAAFITGLGSLGAIAVLAASVVPLRSSLSLRRATGEVSANVISKQQIIDTVGPSVRKNIFPESSKFKISGEEKSVAISYAMDKEIQAHMQKLLNLYQPDYGAFVALDARSGRILSMVSQSKVEPGIENLALQASFPAASIFKVITASAALDRDKVDPNTIMNYNGGNHTLYKRNVSDEKSNRWTRYITMKDAFARSINVVFGKLGLYYVGPQYLSDYASRYQFNQVIKADMPIEAGLTHFTSDDPWSVVTAASGFTRDTTMSPLHGALIAGAVANDGIMMEPYLVEQLTDSEGAKLYQSQAKQLSTVMEPQSAVKLRQLFVETVNRGTSRKWFRKTLKKAVFDEVEFGGKTGSLTGLNPRGKCDWFVGYARYHNTRIAVAALTVNQKKWKVKSSNLAHEFFVKYLRSEVLQDAAALEADALADKKEARIARHKVSRQYRSKVRKHRRRANHEVLPSNTASIGMSPKNT
jgi:penicillin-binding protein A